MPFPLETPRLVIRQFTFSDLAPFHTYRNDPQVAQYQGWDVPYSREKAFEFIDEMKKVTPGTPGEWFQAAVVRKDNNQMIGDVAFHIMRSDSRQAYIGYTLSRAAWGQGYATEAIHRLLDTLFRDYKLHRVVAECDVENGASYRLLERVGFRREAHLKENLFFKGRWSSEYHYAMLEHEWLIR